ncbi:MAG TPA: TIGR00730 family Rossman fold protein, partial [Acidimicrobiales bacterium]
VCVFCGSSSGNGETSIELARHLGRTLGERGLELVYGGAQVGLMGEVADACLAAGGHVIGVLPGGLFAREVPHRGLPELREVATMHERKQVMYDLSDGVIALPGGLGTLEELFEVATWSQIGLHSKPAVLLDADGFWDPLEALLDSMVARAFLKPVNRRLIQRARSPEEALDVLATTELVYAEKWIRPGER